MLTTIISRRRRELRLTLAELAAKVGVSEPTVQRWEKGRIKNLRHDKIVRLANALQMHPIELMGWEQNPTFPGLANAIPLLNTNTIASALPTAETANNWDDAQKNIAADFYLYCRGDSMINARLFDGDIAFIKAQDTIENGTVVAVLIDNEAILGRAYRYHNRLELRTENPIYPTQKFEGAELAKVKILGKVVGFFSNRID